MWRQCFQLIQNDNVNKAYDRLSVRQIVAHKNNRWRFSTASSTTPNLHFHLLQSSNPRTSIDSPFPLPGKSPLSLPQLSVLFQPLTIRMKTAKSTTQISPKRIRNCRRNRPGKPRIPRAKIIFTGSVKSPITWTSPSEPGLASSTIYLPALFSVETVS